MPLPPWPTRHFVVSLTHPNVGAGNPAQITFDQDDTIGTDPAVALAQIIAYVAAQGSEMMCGGVVITGVTVTSSGGSLGVAEPFPAAEYAAIHSAFPALPNLTDYLQNIGRGSEIMTPLGSSMVVTERTAFGGPSGRGRHFLPFVTRNAITSSGTVGSDTTTNVRANYLRFLMDSPANSAIENLGMQLVSANRATTKDILDVTPQPILSNLRSRRR